jgi:hypothetical protein
MTEQTPVQINLQDMKNIIVLIDLCTQRGAFRGAELSSIGQLYEKILGFVEQTEKQRMQMEDPI